MMMRRLALAFLGFATVAAVATAAASSLDVTGPLNPQAGVGQSRVCDLGTVAVTPTLADGYVTQLVVTTTRSNNATGNTCTDSDFWLKVDNGLQQGNGAYYLKVTANGDYRLAPDGQPAVFEFDNAATKKIYSDLEMTNQVSTPPLATDLQFGDFHWVITLITPSTLP